MKKINFIKMSLDVIMSVVFALLFNKMVFGGLKFHEIAGTAIGAAFIIHLGINWRWIKQVSLRIFSNKIAIKTRIGYIVDTLLLIAMVITIISGIAISKVLFTNLNFGSMMFFKFTHMSVPYIALILLGVHLGLHWTWVMNMCKKIFKIPSEKKILDYIAKVSLIAVLAFGIYSLNTTNFFSRVSLVTKAFSTSQTAGGDNNGGFHGNPQMNQAPNGGNMKAQGGNLQESQGQGGTVNGQTNGRPEGKGNPPQGGPVQNVNPLNVVSSYLGVVGVFTIATFYIEKLLMAIKPKGNINIVNG